MKISKNLKSFELQDTLVIPFEETKDLLKDSPVKMVQEPVLNKVFENEFLTVSLIKRDLKQSSESDSYSSDYSSEDLPKRIEVD